MIDHVLESRLRRYQSNPCRHVGDVWTQKSNKVRRVQFGFQIKIRQPPDKLQT